MAFKLKSPDFPAGGGIPRDFSFQGRDINPRLQWSGSPDGTQEIALICEDPDAPSPRPFVHWILYGLGTNVGVIPSGLGSAEWMELPIVARQGRNSLGTIGWTGPNPPFWGGPHRYVFRMVALRAPITLPHGAGREEFERAIEGKVLAQAELIGTYGKPVSDRWRAAAVWAAGIVTVTWLVRRSGSRVTPWIRAA